MTRLRHAPGLEPDATASRPAAAARAPGPRPQRPRVPRRPLHGVLLLDKPLGLSSNDALQQVKRLMRAEKAGHTGTLDPLATGLLPLCFGAATKFSQLSLDADKCYRATLTLGVTRRGGDREGEVLLVRPVQLDRARLDAACARFLGPIEQRPPMHSALKHDGRALYEYAREGVEVERAPRQVTIHALDIVEWQAEHLVIEVRCSKGTYIRTLAEDLGEALGCGAHLAALRRTASGPLDVADAVTLDALAALDESARDALLAPPDRLLADAPAVSLDADDAARFLNGLPRRLLRAEAPLVRVYGPQPAAFLGSAECRAGALVPLRLLSPAEAAQVAAAASPSPHAAAVPTPVVEPAPIVS